MQKQTDEKLAAKSAGALKLRGKGERNVIADWVGEKDPAGPGSDLENMEKLREETEKNRLEKRMNARQLKMQEKQLAEMATMQQRKIFMYKQKSISGILKEARTEVHLLDNVAKLDKIVTSLNPDDHVFEDEA